MKRNRFEEMAEELIEEAEGLPVSLEEFVEGLDLIAEMIKDRANCSRNEINAE
jgi:hypothetical protein